MNTKTVTLLVVLGLFIVACRPKDEQILIDLASFDLNWAASAGNTTDLKQKALQDINQWEQDIKKVQDSAYSLEQWTKIKDFSAEVYGYDSIRKATIAHVNVMRNYVKRVDSLNKAISETNISLNDFRKKILAQREGSLNDKQQLAKYNENLILVQNSIIVLQKQYVVYHGAFDGLREKWLEKLSYAFPKRKKEEPKKDKKPK